MLGGRRFNLSLVCSAAILSIFAFFYLRKPASVKPVKVLESFWPAFNISPTHLESAGDWVALQNIYSNLVEQEGHNTVSPGLAESWTRSVDGLNWKFKLRKNLKWSDGTLMTSDQIVESLRFAMKGTTHTKLAEYVDRIEAIDDTNVEFRLKTLPENFLFTLAFVDLAITHPDARKSDPFSWSAPSSGPYRFLGNTDSSYEIEANTFHWNYSRSTVAKYHLKKAKGDISDYQDLMSGDWDACHLGAGIIGQSELDHLKIKFEVLTGDSDFLIALFFSPKSGAINKIGVEGRKILLTSLYREFWKANPEDPLRATGLRPANIKGALTYRDFDEVIAGMPTKPFMKVSLKLIVLQKHSNRRIFRETVEALEHVGVQLEVSVLEGDQFKTVKKNGSYDLIFQMLGASEGDPDSAWRIYKDYFYEPVVTAQSLSIAQLERDSKKRDDHYKAFERAAVKSAVYIPLKNEVTYIVLNPKLELAHVKTTDWGLKLSKLKLK